MYGVAGQPATYSSHIEAQLWMLFSVGDEVVYVFRYLRQGEYVELSVCVFCWDRIAVTVVTYPFAVNGSMPFTCF